MEKNSVYLLTLDSTEVTLVSRSLPPPRWKMERKGEAVNQVRKKRSFAQRGERPMRDLCESEVGSGRLGEKGKVESDGEYWSTVLQTLFYMDEPFKIGYFMEKYKKSYVSS